MKNLFKLHGIFFISYFFPTFPFPAVCSDNHVKFHFLHFRMLIGVNTSLSWEICKMLIFWVKFQSCRHFKGKNHANVYKASRTRFFWEYFSSFFQEFAAYCSVEICLWRSFATLQIIYFPRTCSGSSRWYLWENLNNQVFVWQEILLAALPWNFSNFKFFSVDFCCQYFCMLPLLRLKTSLR